jgi:hypothetical protein
VAARNTVLKNLKDNNAELEKDVQRLQERKKLQEKVSSYSLINRSMCNVFCPLCLEKYRLAC